MATQARSKSASRSHESQIAPRRRKSGSSTAAHVETPVFCQMPDVSLARSGSDVTTRPAPSFASEIPTAEPATAAVIALPPSSASEPAVDVPSKRRPALVTRAKQEENSWSNLKNLALLLAVPVVLYVTIRLFSSHPEDATSESKAQHADATDSEMNRRNLAEEPKEFSRHQIEPQPIDARDDGAPFANGLAKREHSPAEVPHFPMKGPKLAPSDSFGESTFDSRPGQGDSDGAELNAPALDLSPDQDSLAQQNPAEDSQERTAPHLANGVPGQASPAFSQVVNDAGPQGDSAVENPYMNSDGSVGLVSYPDTGFPPYQFDSLAKHNDELQRNATRDPGDSLRTTDTRSGTLAPNVRLKGNIQSPPIR